MGSGGGGMGGGRHTSAGDADDNHSIQGSMHAGAGLGLIRSAGENSNSFKDSIEIDIDVTEFLQQETRAWSLQHDGGATMLVMDTSALAFRGGGGGSVSDGIRNFLDRTLSGLQDVIVVVSHGQASVPQLWLYVQKGPAMQFPCCMLQHPSYSFLAACCSTQVTTVSLLHAAAPKLQQFPCCMLQRPSYNSFLAACCSTQVTTVSLLHAAAPKLHFACCMLQHPSYNSFLAACCSTRKHLTKNTFNNQSPSWDAVVLTVWHLAQQKNSAEQHEE
jgi:hypothetical protein